MKKQATPERRKRQPAKSVLKDAPSPQADDSRRVDAAFPIVGIGASAGGLEALELFLRNVPEGSRMAFVIVQHLDPTRKGIMVELLQRATAMKVIQVKDRTRVQPDCVYVIPPNRDMSILHGILHLLDPVAPRGLRLPIDFFFRSLADDREERSIGVILSGMGTDGTIGLKAIKEKAGVVFVQEPASAKFDGMPRSAIDAGLADIVAPAEALPGKILAYLQHAPLITKPGLAQEDKAQSALEKVAILLRAQTGHDFSLYKKSTVYRRIERRMGIHQIDKILAYVRFLRENPQELELLFKELLIGVTSFFRDPAAWERLKGEVIPALLAGRSPSQALRAWVPGCATGEEAYSLAMVFKERLEQLKPPENVTLQIFATDLDRDAIEKAREGVFPANIAADVSPERLSRFFVQEARGYQVGKPIREMVIFAPQNVIMDAPFTKLDILSCRNLLIYLTPELQKKLLPLFHYSLNPGGFLFLGNAETIGGFTDLFAPLDDKARLYRRLESALRAEPVEFPASFVSALPGAPQQPKALKPAVNLQSLADQLLLQQYSPAAVLVNGKGDILYISGRTGKYLEPAAGKANWNIFAMAREGLRYELTGAFQKALRQKGAVTLRNVKVGTNGGAQAVDLTAQAIGEPEALRGLVMIVFTDVATPPETKATGRTQRATTPSARVAELERDLEQARHEVQTTREEMQTSQEELKSTNEELQSTNEELQSSNEELTTSKEEMQSLNEELQTVNHELQAKVDELSRMNNDMKNLLGSTEIATVFLDNALRVRLFTTGSNRVFKLILGDVGRPITDISSDLVYPELAEDAREVLRTLVFHEKQVAARDGRWFTVRIMPYRTLENMIDGVVITFTDITTSKTREAKLREAREYAENIVDTVREPLVILDAELRIVTASRSFYQSFNAKPEETEKQHIYDVGKRQWDIPKLRELLEGILPRVTTFDDFEIEHDFPDIGKRTMSLNARKIFSEGGKAQLIVLAIEDITGRRQTSEGAEKAPGSNDIYCAVREIGDSPSRTAQSGGESDEGRRSAPLGSVRGEG
ncbi:MAG: chemotaxis protein CheB [Candidatus Methylomirabilota bacterium]|jgi:two-component system CheB/CheR fusion protein